MSMVTLREHRETIEELFEIFRHEYYVYSPELFELRIREERLRADLLQGSFSYVELGFEQIFTEELTQSELKPLWRSLMQAMRLLVRGSDVKGFLKDDRGIGILFLDTTNPPISRLFAAFRRHLTSADLSHRLRSDLNLQEITTWIYTGVPLPSKEVEAQEEEA